MEERRTIVVRILDYVHDGGGELAFHNPTDVRRVICVDHRSLQKVEERLHQGGPLLVTNDVLRGGGRKLGPTQLHLLHQPIDNGLHSIVVVEVNDVQPREDIDDADRASYEADLVLGQRLAADNFEQIGDQGRTNEGVPAYYF